MAHNKHAYRINSLVTLLLLVVSPVCVPQTASSTLFVNDTNPSEQQRRVKQKLTLLTHMLKSSPAVQRLDAVRDNDVQLLLTEARQSESVARQHLDHGDLATAERSLDAGLRAFGIAARKVADSEREEELERERYQALRKRSAGFIEAFARTVSEKGVEASTLLNEIELYNQLDKAEALAQEQKHRDANVYLSSALRILEQALSEIRDKETLVQTLSFDSPTEEYAYERERNQSHQMLIRLMLAERELPVSSHTMIEALLGRNETARTQAIKLAEQGDTTAAIQLLEEGTGELVKALRLTGLSF